jgi:hypothetical protein
LRVEPRPLRSDARLQGVTARDLDNSAKRVSRGRTAFLRARTASPVGNADEDMRCVFSRGVPVDNSARARESAEVRAGREACVARGPFTTYVLGLTHTRRGETSKDIGDAGKVMVRTFRLTAWSFELWDVDCGPRSGGFDVVARRRLGGAAS